MPNKWMIRASGGELIDDFRDGIVAIGWFEVGDLSKATTPEAIRKLYDAAYADHASQRAANDVAMLHKFRSIIRKEDIAVSYDPGTRQYLVGEVTSDYIHDPSKLSEYPHIRKVSWGKPVSRDDLSKQSRNSLGSTLTLFAISDEVWKDIEASRSGQAKPAVGADPIAEAQEAAQTKEDVRATALENIKDKISGLSDSDLEVLTAALLRAMGYKTRLSPRGPDRGVDVMASPDGLGLEQPRIKVEVKHRPRSQMGAQDIRSFLGALREGDRGLYVSTGGFTREAKYEADRSSIPVALLDLEDLANLIVQNYETFDIEARTLLPLTKVYWPSA